MSSRLEFNDKQRVADWVALQVDQTADWGSYYAMGIESNGELIAGAVLNNFNGSDATVHIAIVKVCKLLPVFLKHAFDYAFNHCKLNRLTGLVEADNKKALKLNKHLGFEQEYTIKKGGRKGQDMVMLVMWPNKCRWI